MKKIVCTDSFSDKDDNIVSATEYGMENMPQELEVTITFEETQDGKTKMTLKHVGLPGGQMKELTSQGWGGSFDKLAASLVE